MKNYPNPQKKIYKKLFVSKIDGKAKKLDFTDLIKRITKGERILESLKRKQDYYLETGEIEFKKFIINTEEKMEEVKKEINRLKRILDRGKVKKEITKIIKKEVKKEIKKEMIKVNKKINKKLGDNKNEP